MLLQGTFPDRHHARDLFDCGPAGHLGSFLGSWESLGFHTGSQTVLKNVPNSGLGSAAEVVQFASSP